MHIDRGALRFGGAQGGCPPANTKGPALGAGTSVRSPEQSETFARESEEVAARRDRYTVGSLVAKLESPVAIDPRLQALYKKTAELVGIEKQSEKLVKMLSLGDDDVHASDERMRIVSIIEFGGLGKTTLSKAVYDKHKPAFDCGAFVPVGRNPNMKKVFRDILVEFDYINPNLMVLDERQLINELRKLIQNKRYENLLISM